jgi:hypothetical protein
MSRIKVIGWLFATVVLALVIGGVTWVIASGRGYWISEHLDPEYPKYSTEIVYLAADFSGDGSKVYFLKEVRGWKQVRPRAMWGGMTIEKSYLWLCSMRPDGTEKKQIKTVFPPATWIMNKTDSFVHLAVCPKDDRIAWTSIGSKESIDGLWVMDADGQHLKRVLDGNKVGLTARPKWSSDGVYVVAQADDASWKSRVWRSRADGSENLRLTKDGEEEERPSFSPDGKRIAFTRVIDDEYHDRETELWIMDIDGGNRKKLLGMDEKIQYWNRQWLDDNRIMFWDARRGNIALDLKTMEMNVLDHLRGSKVSPKEEYFLSVGPLGLFVRPAGSVAADGPRVPLESRTLENQRLRDLLHSEGIVW